MNKVLARGFVTIAAVNDGKDGQTPHLHIAYANSPDGKVGFSTDDSKDRAYIGQYVSYTDEPDSTDAGMYTWSRIKGNDAVVWHVAFSIRNIAGKQGEKFKLKYGRTEGENTSWFDDNPTYNGFDRLYAVVIDGATGNERETALGVDLNVADFFTGGSLTVHLMNNKTGEILAQDTIYPEAKPGKDAITYKLIPMVENALAYFTEVDDNNTENSENKKKKAEMVDLNLKYRIQKSVGEQVTFTTLTAEGMTLSAQPDDWEFDYEYGSYCLEADGMGYVEIPNNSYVVTLKRGSHIVDQRIVPVTFKPKVVFNIDTELGKVSSDISTVDGRVNLFEQDIKKTKATVGNLKEQYSQLEIKSNEISLTVNNGTRPNLLWGSDLNLDGVDTTNKAAIQKHLGVGIANTKIDSVEWFEYLKGGGVSGADALKFKAMKGTSEFAGLFWEFYSGAARDIQLKPNTVYTLSAWVRIEFDTKAQGYGVFAFEAFKKEKENSAQRVGRLKFKAASSFYEPIGEWTRVSATFTTEELLYGSVAMWMGGTKPATLYICHPKLEEGDTATPWCAYDGTTEALLASGLDIKNREYIATADNFKVQNNKGEQTFLVDQDGKLNTKLINANEIFAFKVAQPFETYTTDEDLKAGKSLSWTLEGSREDYGIFTVSERFNGACFNIFNNTERSVSLMIPLIEPFKLRRIFIPSKLMLRAIAVYRKEWDGCRWYMLCPWKNVGNDIYIKSFGITN